MIQLKIITSTTREGRKGIFVANWITEYVQNDKDFEVQLLDLAEINLPFMDEPNHPSLGEYVHQHTKEWSKTIASADAFIIVLGEYNFGYPAPIKNALDYLHKEWKYKPVALVSYGGISGGLRSTQMLKQVLTSLGMMPIVEQVALPFFAEKINEEGKFISDDRIHRAADKMLEELKKWSRALKSLRD